MEFNILIVDDDIALVDKLTETVNWKKTGISAVFSAYNIRQAKQKLKENPVHLLLCDIDMPQGSGLELLEWIRNEGMEDLECIFLSSYANFAYAQLAMRLSSREYLVKPLSNEELETVLSKAVREIRQKRVPEEPQEARRAPFWETYLQTSSGHRKLMENALSEGSLRQDDVMFLVMIKVFADERDENYRKDLNLFCFVIQNVALEIFDKHGITIEELARLKDFEWMLVVKNASGRENFRSASAELKKYLDNILPRSSCMYIGLERGIWETEQTLEWMEKTERSALPGVNGILEEYEKADLETAHYKRPHWEIWQKSLEETGTITAVCDDICLFLQETAEIQRLTVEWLDRFLVEMEEFLHGYISRCQFGFADLFDSREYEQKKRETYISPSGREDFVRWIFERLQEKNQEQDQENVVERVKDYIEKHLDTELSRTLLAKEVHLSEAYVSKLFRSTTGMGLPGYIAERRMEKAKEYLIHSGLPVSRIAMEVGYDNFSYFSKTFREMTGMTPNEFRSRKI